MEPADLQVEGPRTWEREQLSSSNCDGFKIREKGVQRSRLTDCGFKDAELEDCSFNHSYFERCYFRKARFFKVSFVGCHFRDCRFDDAVFSECHFERAEFHNCSVTFSQLQSCLPSFENVLREFARNLRVNAQNRGATEDSRAFLLEEIRASEIHYYKMAFAWNDPFYSKKYGRWEDRLLGLWRWSLSKTDRFFWGYGEVPSRVVWASAIIVAVFAMIYWSMGVEFRNMANEPALLEYIGLSAATFATMNYGDLVAVTRAGRLLTTVEACLGLLFFGFLAAAVYRKISRR